MLMNRLFFLVFCLMGSQLILAQSFDEDRIILANFVERLYTNSPFEGCRIIDDYDNNYLLSVVVLDESKYNTKSAMNRMAQVKSQRNAGEFLNGTQSFSEFIIRTPKGVSNRVSEDVWELSDQIRTNTTGYVQQMQLLTSFEDEDKLKVFVYFKEL